MSRIGLIGSSTLIGTELKEELGRRSEPWSEIRLLTFDTESIGRVSDVAGAATFVTTVSEETLEGLDVIVLAGERVAGRDLASEIPSEATLVVVAPDTSPEGAVPLVDGVNLINAKLPDAAIGHRLLASPHPAAIALSLLLHSLRGLGEVRADGYLMMPSSSRGQEGLDELLAQSRGLLAFQSDLPQEVFGRQLAFNSMPSVVPAQSVIDERRGGARRLDRPLCAALGGVHLPRLRARPAPGLRG